MFTVLTARTLQRQLQRIAKLHYRIELENTVLKMHHSLNKTKQKTKLTQILCAHSQLQICASNFYVCIYVKVSRGIGQEARKGPMR